MGSAIVYHVLGVCGCGISVPACAIAVRKL